MSTYDRIVSPTASQTATLVGEPEPEDDVAHQAWCEAHSSEVTEGDGDLSIKDSAEPDSCCTRSDAHKLRQHGSIDFAVRSHKVSPPLDSVTEHPFPSKPSAVQFSPSASTFDNTLSRCTTFTSTKKPYSAFAPATIWLIVILGSVAALFSPLSSNIFVPAIPTLSDAFQKTNQQIALAVSVYLIFQAITPSFFGSMSDSWGRRPVFIATLSIYLAANIGLSFCPTDAYWLLLTLRALQATGGSSVVSIGVGAIGDVAEPRERGKYMAIFQAGVQIGPSFGPVLGGIFASTLGWRSIFGFMAIATGVVLLPLILFYPETLRSLVGDGSIAPPALNASPLLLLQRRRERRHGYDFDSSSDRPAPKPYHPLSAFYILFTPEITLVFIFASMLYTEYYCVLTVYSTALADEYKMSALQIGLCYIPGGIGCIISSILNGKQLDYYYQREEKRVGGDYREKPDEFRIYLTRLRCLVPFMACFLVGCTMLGWCLHAKAPLPVTLVANFLCGLGTGTTASATVYGQDIKPGQGGAVSASLNLIRCILAAIGSALINLLYDAVGAGWTFVLLSGLVLLSAPLPVIVLKNGDKWRRAREAKMAQNLATADEKTAEVEGKC